LLLPIMSAPGKRSNDQHHSGDLRESVQGALIALSLMMPQTPATSFLGARLAFEVAIRR
jgi:hypothetical protein